MKPMLYILIGPKGAGKTHIGTVVERHTDIRFLRVEPLWLALKAGEDGWKKVEFTIDMLFHTHDRMMIESLGVGEGFRAMHESLARKYRVRMIRVIADLETCLARVKSRSRADHIAVSDEKVVEYNRIAAAVSCNWDLEIDNAPPASDADIIRWVRSIGDAPDRA